MAYSEALMERYQLFRDTVAFKKTKRVPNLSCIITWKVLDSEYKLTEAHRDYDVMERIMTEFHERYQFDAYADMGFRNNIRIGEALGTNYYYFDDETGAINYQDRVIMQGDEYGEFVQDPMQFYYKMFLRKYPDLTYGQMVKGIQEVQKFGAFMMKMETKCLETFECPLHYNNVVMLPFEAFYHYYRGIKEISLDMRKRKTELNEALNLCMERDFIPAIENALASEGRPAAFDLFIPLLAHSIMNQKQFEEFYWPGLKLLIDRAVAAGKTVYIYSESNIMRFVEYFQDIPKGYVVIHPELDDFRQLHKALPNIALAGGMKTEYLGYKTPQECADYAKALLDDMGEGFIFSQDKMISFKNDCRRENLLAVNEVVRNYRV